MSTLSVFTPHYPSCSGLAMGWDGLAAGWNQAWLPASIDASLFDGGDRKPLGIGNELSPIERKSNPRHIRGRLNHYDEVVLPRPLRRCLDGLSATMIRTTRATKIRLSKGDLSRPIFGSQVRWLFISKFRECPI